MRWTCAVALGAAATCVAHAQDIVYRCHDHGSVSYTRAPCGLSSGRAVNVADARTPEQRLAALDRVQRQHVWLQQAQHQRAMAERSAQNLAPAGFQTSPRTTTDDATVRKVKKPRLKPPKKSRVRSGH